MNGLTNGRKSYQLGILNISETKFDNSQNFIPWWPEEDVTEDEAEVLGLDLVVQFLTDSRKVSHQVGECGPMGWLKPLNTIEKSSFSVPFTGDT